MNCKLKDGILEAWRRHPRNQLISKYLQRRHFSMTDGTRQERASRGKRTSYMRIALIHRFFKINKPLIYRF
ncbi:unknown [Prevotella sp. CAG:1058]|nr:unknown [Prevotella sp. CAG:1058]